MWQYRHDCAVEDTSDCPHIGLPWILMKRNHFLLYASVVAATLLPLVPTLKADNAKNVDETRGQIELLRTRLLQTRSIFQEIQELERKWSEDQGLLEDSRDTRKNEITLLNDDIEAAKERKTADDKATVDRAEKRTEIEEAIKVIEEELPRFETRLRKFADWLPDPLKERLKGQLKQLGNEELLASAPVTDRLQLLLRVVTEAEKFQGAIYPVESDMRAGKDGQKREVSTIYYGLAVAYSASGDGELALIGTPAKGGWVFEEHPEIAKKISKIVTLGNNRGEPEIVPIPVTIQPAFN
jgi:hypothetical protein